MPKKGWDFAGWVTKNDIRCSDGVTIRKNAFQDNDDKTVPLVWEHVHNDPTNVLGHMVLHNQGEGVYGYGYLNDTDEANHARTLIEHGDINSMSIAANKLKKQGNNVMHGRIFEVSLVLAGANPGALIDTIVSHSDEEGESAIVYLDTLIHSSSQDIDDKKGGTTVADDKKSTTDTSTTDKKDDGKTLGDVLGTLTDEQMSAVEQLVGLAVSDAQNNSDDNSDDATKKTVTQTDIQEGEEIMQHNVFDSESNAKEAVLQHSALNEALEVAKTNKVSSLQDVLKASLTDGDSELEHSITGIEKLFPDYKNVTPAPVIYKDQNRNAQAILDATTKSPFSRIKTMFADLTEDEARARGYIKGKEKLEQIFGLLSRTTDPQTIYKKQKLDRDDIIDITDFDVVQFISGEMKMMLIEEISRAILVGDGRLATDASKISEDHIRPIISDEDFYSIKDTIPTVNAFLENVILDMADFEGSGVPNLYINPKLLAKIKLVKKTDGSFLFGDIPSNEVLAAKLGVSTIVPTTFLGVDKAIITNLSDYHVGSTKGGEITNFDDFDIDFNQYKYLIETRLSGALVTPKSALVLTVTSETPASTPAPAKG